MAIEAGDSTAHPAAGSVVGSVHGKIWSFSLQLVFVDSHEVAYLPVAET